MPRARDMLENEMGIAPDLQKLIVLWGRQRITHRHNTVRNAVIENKERERSTD